MRYVENSTCAGVEHESHGHCGDHAVVNDLACKRPWFAQLKGCNV